MSCWALVPIKARAECKGRLRTTLNAPARRALAREMLTHVLTEAARSNHIDRVVVVSPERDTLPPEISVVTDQGTDLNDALQLGRRFAFSQGARELLVLAADLPEITVAEIDALIDTGRRRGIAIATDRSGIGTNALFIAMPPTFEFCFGPDSRSRHEREARRHGIVAALCRSPGLAADLDTGADMGRWLWEGQWSGRRSTAEVSA